MGRTDPVVEHQRAVESGDPGRLLTRFGPGGAEVLECGRQCEEPRTPLEQLDSFGQVFLTAAQQAARVSGGGGHRIDVGVEIGAALGGRHAGLRELEVVRGHCDPHQLYLVGEVHRKAREDRFAFLRAQRTQPFPSSNSVALVHRLEREQPCRVAADARAGFVEHELRELGGLPDQTRVVGVKSDATERHHSGRVADRRQQFLGREVRIQQCGSLLEPPELQELASSPEVQHVHGPRLPIARCRGGAFGGELEGLVDAVENDQGATQELRRYSLAGVCSGVVAEARGRLDQLE